MASVARIKSAILAGTLSFESALAEVDQALAAAPASALWLMRGRLIQLADSPAHDLADAEASFLAARALVPDDPQPALELGHFYDTVIRDRGKARAFYLEAIALGAGEEASLALADLGQD